MSGIHPCLRAVAMMATGFALNVLSQLIAPEPNVSVVTQFDGLFFKINDGLSLIQKMHSIPSVLQFIHTWLKRRLFLRTPGFFNILR
jgi:hypothetical protein